MIEITRVAQATGQAYKKINGPDYATYLAVYTDGPINKGHRECIMGAIATFNNKQKKSGDKFRVGFNGAVIIGRKNGSSAKEIRELLSFVAGCIGHEGELPGLEGECSLVNPGLALVLPGSDAAKTATPIKSERGTAKMRRAPNRRY